MADHLKLGKKINWENKLINKESFPKPTPPNNSPLPKKLHYISGVVGCSGQGKTNFLINLILELVKAKLFNKIIVISDTAFKDDDIGGIRAEGKWDLIDQHIHEIHPRYSHKVMDDIIENQREDIKKYSEYLNLQKAYDKAIKGQTLTTSELIALDEIDFDKEKITNPNESRMKFHPTLCLIFDDVGYDVKPTDLRFHTKIGKIRHYNTSIFQAVQYLNQLARMIRTNLNLIFIWKTSNEKYLKDIYDQFGACDMKYETFEDMFKLLEDRHEFITIDVNAPSEQKYRINFNQFIEVTK